MPHFDLIPDGTPADTEALMRAKLHIRGGHIRLFRKQYADALASFYDAFSTSMARLIEHPFHRRRLQVHDGEDVTEDRTAFRILKRAQIIDATFSDDDFEYISRLLDCAMEANLHDIDEEFFFNKFDNVMTQLGVLPILDGELPDEIASTT